MYGGYSTAVSTSGCGPDDLGSTPSSHPDTKIKLLIWEFYFTFRPENILDSSVLFSIVEVGWEVLVRTLPH